MLSCKVATVGSSSGLILSEEAMARLGIRKGDTVFLTEAPGGGYIRTRVIARIPPAPHPPSSRPLRSRRP